MRKYFLAGAVIILFFLPGNAHEFWLQPNQYFFQPGDKAKVDLMVGENFMGEPWDLNRHRIEELQLYFGNETRDLREAVNKAEHHIALDLPQPGTYMLTMRSNEAFLTLPGADFNAYLEEDGLDDILSLRKSQNQLDKTSREFYSRYTKLFLQCGDARNDIYKKAIGFPIEIIPQQNPYALRKGQVMRFRILWKGKPLFGARVKVWNRADHRTTVQNLHSDQEGMVETNVSSVGPWMISVVKMIPSQREGADYQSYWGSLVFAVK